VVFGATGYLGGRLVPALLAAGHQVRVLARAPGKLAEVPWRDRVEILEGDVTDPGSVRDALAGQDVVYYLVHSLNRRDFVEVDRRAAHVLADAVRVSGVGRLVYLGGITPDAQRLSDHLASRASLSVTCCTT
jgi:uncharacterized protein YbjT (DUF2867 family)